jgi:hypothetical protein
VKLAHRVIPSRPKFLGLLVLPATLEKMELLVTLVVQGLWDLRVQSDYRDNPENPELTDILGDQALKATLDCLAILDIQEKMENLVHPAKFKALQALKDQVILFLKTCC